MKLYKTIRLDRPVRHIRVASATSPNDPEQNRIKAEKDAYEGGRRDAEKGLREQLLQQRTELLQMHQGVVEALRGAVPQVARQAERALIELSLEAARKIVAGLPIDSQLVEAVVREAVSQVEDNAEVTIHLHPDDLALLRKHESPILQGSPETGSLRFIHSSEVTRGGCVVHTRFGLIDARRETKMEQLRNSLPA